MEQLPFARGMRWRVGNALITPLYEGMRTFTPTQLDETYPGVRTREEDIGWLRPGTLLPSGEMVMSFQTFLVEAEGLKILIDTGDNAPGLYDAALAEAGVARDEVDYILFTHLHFDHIARNVTIGSQNTLPPAFPRARYLIGRTEYDWWYGRYRSGSWLGEAEEEKALRPFLLQVLPLEEAGAIELIDPGPGLPGGLCAIATPGHTPGHLAYLLRSGNDAVYFVGDAFHMPFQVTQPAVSAVIDPDPAASTASRLMLLERMAADGGVMAACHFAAPYAGRVQRAGDGYSFSFLAQAP